MISEGKDKLETDFRLIHLEKEQDLPPRTSSIAAVVFHRESKGSGELNFLGGHCNFQAGNGTERRRNALPVHLQKMTWFHYSLALYSKKVNV